MTASVAKLTSERSLTSRGLWEQKLGFSRTESTSNYTWKKALVFAAWRGLRDQLPPSFRSMLGFPKRAHQVTRIPQGPLAEPVLYPS